MYHTLVVAVLMSLPSGDVHSFNAYWYDIAGSVCERQASFKAEDVKDFISRLLPDAGVRISASCVEQLTAPI